MADNDYNIIKPVEGLQTIGGLTPAKRRKERKQRQDLHKQNEEQPEQKLNDSIDEQGLRSELAEDEGNQNTIDYRA